MLLTLNANSVRAIVAAKGGSGQIPLNELPRFTRQTLGLSGLTLPTTMLAGLTRTQLNALREQGDRNGCAILTLIEEQPQRLAAKESIAEQSIDRLYRVLQAAHTLGCSSAVIKIEGNHTDELFMLAIERTKAVAERAEKLEVSMLIAPQPGLTETPERVTQLIKRVGGFRVGAYPDFSAAAATDDPAGYMRRITPYAAGATATLVDFTPRKRSTKPLAEGETETPAELDVDHSTYDVDPLIRAMLAVGYDGSLAIDFRGNGDATLGVLRSRHVLERSMASIQQED